MTALQPLLHALAQTEGRCLWLADESNASAIGALQQHRDKVHLISNRFGIAQVALENGLTAEFSDFDLGWIAALPDSERPQNIFYRVSKERPLVNHLINRAFELLPLGGSLWLAGHKNEGIKNYHKQAGKLFGGGGRLIKDGDVYWGSAQKTTKDTDALLDDRRYTTLRWIEQGEFGFYSKPGTYGWDKVDKGSAFLIETVRPLLMKLDTAQRSLLDLGCGYGYLTLQCRDLAFKKRVATDNNAAAIRCVHANAEHYEMDVTVVADDCAENITGHFDVVLCNPPFHQGFDVESDLTDKFLQNTIRCLAAGGRAYVVVNTFIPLEQKAAHIWSNNSGKVTTLANNKHFKVIEIRN